MLFRSTEGTASAVDVNSGTGMVGSPALKTGGSVEVKTLLNPAIRVGGLVNLASVAINGLFKVQTMETDGDSWEGPFYSVLTLTPQG